MLFTEISAFLLINSESSLRPSNTELFDVDFADIFICDFNFKDLFLLNLVKIWNICRVRHKKFVMMQGCDKTKNSKLIKNTLKHFIYRFQTK